MSTIDERIVEMKFKGGQFAGGVKATLDQLAALKKGLNLDGAKKSLENLDAAGKNFSLDGIANGVGAMASKFTALGVIGVTALATIANRAVTVGLDMVRSLTVDPVKAGLEEYETKLGSIQTILANTQSKGTNLGDVTGALAELNTYSDKTIYNFAEMARNIGTFTAAGVDLDTSTTAIKGIANLAALSGSNSQQASTAMYQLSQALGNGKVSLMDWNSVVNAGMGGEVFQTALKETARAQGVAIDDIIAKNGSFRDSLQDGWLTSDILTSTLSTFTGDLTREQIISMGYTEDQVAGIMEMAKTASDAATKVKTFSQLVGTLQESAGSGWAETWELIFGDIEEAKSLWTSVNDVLGGMIGASSDARNKMIGDWDALGGRTAAIDAIKNAFNALMAIFKPVQEAFSEVFPAVTGQQLFDITAAIRDFTASLMPSEEALANIKRTFAGVFAVLDIGRMILVGALNMFAGLFGTATEGSGAILNITANIGDFLVKMRDAIKNGDGLNKFFEGLGKVLSVPINLLKMLGGLFADAINGIANIDTSGFTGAVDRMQTRMEPLARLGEFIRGVWAKLVEVFRGVSDFFAPFAASMGQVFGELGTGISEAFSSIGDIDFDTILDVINTGLFAGLVLLIKKFLSDGFTVGIKADVGGGILDKIKSVFGGLTDTMAAMQTQLKANALLKIAGAIALLTVSVVALSLIDSVALAKALGAITVMFGQLLGSMAIMEKVAASKGAVKLPVVAAAMILLAIAIDLLAIAVAKLSSLDWNELARGLVGVTVLLGVMSVATDKMNPEKLGPTAAGLILIAIAINILASAVKSLAELDWNELARGLVGVGVILGALTLFTKMAEANKGAVAQGAGLLLLAVALKVMASAVIDFASLDWNELARGVVGLAAVLGVLAGFVVLTSGAKGMIGVGIGLVILAAALKIIASAVIDFASLDWNELARGLVGLSVALLVISVALVAMQGTLLGAAAMIVAAAAISILADSLIVIASLDWNELARGLVGLAVSLAIIAGALYLMTAALPGAAALLVAAAALAVLAPVMVMLGKMSWDEIGAGLAVLASMLGILAVGGILMIAALPGLIGLGIAITLIGAGTLMAGAGLLAFSIGLTALSVAGAVASVAIVAMVSAIIGLIPLAMQKLAEGIIAFALVISTSGPAIVAALVTVLMSLLTAISTLAPQIVSTLLDLVFLLVDALVSSVPRLVDAGLQMLTGILNGIANNIGQIVTSGLLIITNFIDGISDGLPQLVQSGINLVITFVESIADGIRDNTERMNAAGGDLASAIIDGMANGIGNGVGTVISAAKNMATNAFEAAMTALDAHSPSRKFFALGEWSDQGLANGLIAHSSVVEKAAAGVGDNALTTMKKSMSGISNAISSDIEMAPVIRPVLDLSAIKKGAGTIDGVLGTPSLTLDKTYARAASIAVQQRETTAEKTTTEAPAPSPGISFTQILNSPKAISHVDAYRQTKNLLSTAEGVVNNAD